MNTAEVSSNQSVVTRTITVVSTRGEKKKFDFSGTTWAELKSVLSHQGYSLTNMKCVEGINKTTLEHPKAIIPTGDFNLFLMPYKTKSGGPAKDRVKALFADPAIKPAAREHFGNYTQQKEEVLAELLKSWKAPKKASSKANTKAKVEARVKEVTKKSADKKVKKTEVIEVAGKKVKAVVVEPDMAKVQPVLDEKAAKESNGVAEVVEAVKESKVAKSKQELSYPEIAAGVRKLSTRDKLFLLSFLSTAIADALDLEPASFPTEKQEMASKINARKEAEVKKPVDTKAENKELDAEFDELIGGFNDVQSYRTKLS